MFNRFDICEAYYLLEVDYNVGGWLHERKSNVRRGIKRGCIGEATHVQLARLGFKPRPDLSYETLSDNGKKIYDNLERTYKLGKFAPVLCDSCGKECISDGFTSGYGIDEHGNKHCFDCCAKFDVQYMETHDKIDLYLTEENYQYYVSNWPGTLKFKVHTPYKGNHNIAGTRYDVWFSYAGKHWHGVQYGDNTQIIHCKVVKG